MTAVLDQKRHERLLANADALCERAGIPKAMLHTSAKQFCNATELEWVTKFRLHQVQGENLVLYGSHEKSPEQKMQAMAGAFLRNFIDARVVSVNQLIEDPTAYVECTVLLVPNFYVELVSGRHFPAHKVQQLYDLLLTRSYKGKMTVLYVQSRKAMKEQYGQAMAEHIESYIVSQDD